jgi:hypothetical protein
MVLFPRRRETIKSMRLKKHLQGLSSLFKSSREVRDSISKRQHAFILRVHLGTPRQNSKPLAEPTEQGQTKPVYVKKLIYKEGDAFISVEEEILALQGHKSIVCSKVLNDERIENQIPVKRTNDKISILDIKKIFGV